MEEEKTYIQIALPDGTKLGKYIRDERKPQNDGSICTRNRYLGKYNLPN